MMLPDDPRERRAAIIAACVTFGVALVIFVFLFFMTLSADRREVTDATVLPAALPDDEEVFLEPELLVIDNPGDENVPDIDEAAPQAPGQPDPAPEEQKVQVMKNEKPPVKEPVSNKKELVATPKENDVKTSTPKLTPEEEKRIASMQGKLKTDNNGASSGKESPASGSGGNGVSFSGNVNGRKMLSCPTWKLKLTQKTTVKVNITVDADGNVTSATAVSGGTANLRNECQKMALRSKWTAKAGAKPTTGTITFTISPN